MATTVITRKKSEENPDQEILRQIDLLQDQSRTEREKQLGGNFLSEAKDFYSLSSGSANSPTFRPRVLVPQLQTLFLNESTDLSDSSPRIYILSKGSREKQREQAYQEYWRQNYFNNRLLMAYIWSMFCGVGFLQIGYDPHGRRGKGEVWIQERDPGTVFPDPNVVDDSRWAFVILEDRMLLDEVRAIWPKGYQVKPRGGPRVSIGPESSEAGLTFPPGPMSATGTGGAGQVTKYVGGAVVNVRQTYVRDYTVDEVPEEERKRMRETLGPLAPAPKYKRRFPQGRWIVDCDGVVLADGPNQIPFGWFPVIPYHSMPPLGSFWNPPPMRYTRPLQELSQRLYTQVFENAVRLNNGIWFIPEDTGISADDFGGIPAEIRIINANARFPEVKWPSAMPSHMVQLPALLLQLQKELQGFSPARAGEPGAGNISANLYDATVFQSQYMTRLRARLMAESLQRTAELVFYTMARFFRDDQVFYGFGEEGPVALDWKKPLALEDYEVMLDPGSVRVVSGAALRQLVVALLDKGHMPLKFALETLDFPNAGEIAEEQRKMLELAAVSKLKRPR